MKPDFDIQEELRKLPTKPGVYLMHDASDEIIYVGKAVVLRNRVRQYFQSSRGKTEKIRRMVEHIQWFEYIVTDSEAEALMLECNLIKEHRPKYNTMLVDDKGYPFVRVTVQEPFPRVFVTRNVRRDKSRYFGPYASAGAIHEAIELLRKVYKTRTCNRVLPRDIGKERPCLNADMGLCSAPCDGRITEEAYRESVRRVIRFLEGSDPTLEQELKREMKAAADEERYEDAMVSRDLLRALQAVTAKQKMTDAEGSEDRDFIAGAIDGEDGVASVFFVRNGQLIGRDHYHVRVQEDTEIAEMLEDFVKLFYSGTPYVPKEVFLETEISDREAIESFLGGKRGQKVSVFVPKKGQKERFLLLAKENASMVLTRDKEKMRREEERTTGAVRELESILGLSGLHRMEAFDISNISGFESVGSMVVFYDGKPKKNDYRRFRIRTVTGPDDYESMREVLSRRFRHGLEKDDGKFSDLPDILLMDGGKGQVHAAEQVLSEFSLSIPVAGMVKDDRHRTRGIYYRDVELPIDTHGEAFHLITRIQDEAHRFAITYHRGLHAKNAVKSVLSEIPGVGKKREISLMKRFADIDALRAASVEEILETEGFNRRAAESVYGFLHEEKTHAEENDSNGERK